MKKFLIKTASMSIILNLLTYNVAFSFDSGWSEFEVQQVEPTDTWSSSAHDQQGMSSGFTRAATGSNIQNAVLEGIQITSEATKVPDERNVTCYFIFRDKPSNYFYDINHREKKLIFEFNDAQRGASPLPAINEPPIKNFTIEEFQIDINKDIEGLTPEWHDVIRIVFNLDAIPLISVRDEYTVISFNFKWTTNPEKIPLYSVHEKNRSVILWSAAGLTTLGLGVLAYFRVFKPKEDTIPGGPIPINDLPNRP